MSIFSKLERAVGLKKKTCHHPKKKAEHKAKHRRTPPRRKDGRFKKR